MKTLLSLVAFFAGCSFSFAGNCTAGGVVLTQSGSVVTQSVVVQQPSVVQTFAVNHAVSAPVIAVAQVPLVQQSFFSVATVQQPTVVIAHNFRNDERIRVRSNGNGGGNRQVGLVNIQGGRGGVGASGFGGGNRQVGLFNFSR